MPRIPTRQRTESIGGRPMVVSAGNISSSVFRGSFSQARALESPRGAFSFVDIRPIGRGLVNVAGSLQESRVLDARILKQEEHRRNDAWVLDTLYGENLAMAEYFHDPANSQSETFATDFQSFANSRLEQALRNAPSEEAALDLRARMLSNMGRRMETALSVSFTNRIDGDLNMINDAVASALKSYRLSRNPESLAESYEHLLTTGFNMFDEVAPKTARALARAITEEFALAAVEDSPALAENIVNSSINITEADRQSIVNKVAAKRQRIDVVKQDQFNQVRDQKKTSAAIHGRDFTPIPLPAYESVYPEDRARVEKAKDDRFLKSIQIAHDTIGSAEGTNSQNQIQVLTNAFESIETSQDEQVYNGVIRPAIQDSLERMESDPVSWLSSHNPIVEEIGSRLTDATEEEAPAILSELNDQILKFQGYAPEGEAEDNLRFYLNRPSNQRNLLSLSDANRIASDINNTAPEQALGAIEEFLVRFDAPEHQWIAFRDLVNLPESGSKIKQEYQLAFQNRGAWWVDNYLSSLRAGEDLKKLKPDTHREIVDHLDGHEQWRRFTEAMIGTNLSRSNEIVGFRDGIVKYAMGINQSGMTPKESIKLALDRLVGSSFGFADVNGETLMIPRTHQMSDGTMGVREDSDITRIGRSLNTSLSLLDGSRVDQTKFPILDSLGPDVPTNTERNNMLRRMISQEGQFQLSPDGQSATLHFPDDDGFPFQVTDKQGNPFVIHFDRTIDDHHLEIARFRSGFGEGEAVQRFFSDISTHKEKSTGIFTNTYWPIFPGIRANPLLD